MKIIKVPEKEQCMKHSSDVSKGANIEATTYEFICGLCQVENENLEHLFFSCSYSQEIWKQVLLSLGVNRTVLPWHEEVQIAEKKSRSTQKQACKYSIAFIESVYCIWLQRNAKVFRDHVDPVKTVVSNIMFNVECRCKGFLWKNVFVDFDSSEFSS
ncbi:uncharacterized protein [Spinacia oleracea]|uniref:Reverse transcriptase zinc-binding domain-containing protein n=1 Tax=Spinacia oleracea TaxID=3562 RepID=A0ABM3QQV0_SPIOL|nr:uncharacterized protein LOC130461617 [Spinacia oleracea]